MHDFPVLFHSPGCPAQRAVFQEHGVARRAATAYDGMAAASRVRTPSLFVHGDGCVFPDHVRQIRARLQGESDLVWTEGTQTDFYDQPGPVGVAVDSAARWFDKTLRH